MNSDTTRSTLTVAEALVALCRAGKFLEAGESLWADDVISIEPFQGEMAHLQGKQAAAAKGKWWLDAHEIHGVEVGDPYVNGDQFIVRYVFDATVRQTGQRMTLDELGVYTVRGGHIAEEQFFVLKSYFDR